MSFCGNFIGFKCSFKNADGCIAPWRRLGEAHRGRNLPGDPPPDGTNGCSVYYDADDIKYQFAKTVPDTIFALGEQKNLSWSYSMDLS